MAINFECPECRQKFRTEDAYAGREWRCPKCSASFAIPEPDDIPVEHVTPRSRPPRGRDDDRDDDWDERDERDPDYRRRRIDRVPAPGWASVRGGLRVLSTALTILLVALVAYILVVVVASVAVAGGGGGGPGGGGVWVLVAAVLVVLVLAGIVSFIMVIVGQAMCCSAPSESGTKGFAVGSMICLVLTIVLSMVGFIALFAMLEPNMRGFDVRIMAQRALLPVAMIALAQLLGLVGHILFILFMRSVAVYFRNDSLAANIIVFLIVDGLTIVGLFVVSIFVDSVKPGAGGQGAIAAVGILGLVLLVMLLALFAWFMYLLSATRSCIPSPERERRRD